MADISEFSIVTYMREVRPGMVVGGDQVRSIVTPDDYASESEAKFAAEKLTRRL
jgi:hypothetical protein